jgi:hypothetical protein
LSALVIREPILGGTVQITGGFITIEQANDMAGCAPVSCLGGSP